jgi:hypothetical protein
MRKEFWVVSMLGVMFDRCDEDGVVGLLDVMID